MTKKQTSGIIHVVPKVESWKVPGVVYRGKTGTYEVIREMIPSMTQDEQVAGYGIEIPSMSLVWAIADRAYDLSLISENPETAESLRNFLQVCLRRYLNTSTRLVYNPQGIGDEVIHNYNTSAQYALSGNFVGPDGWIQKLPNKKALELVLETSNVNKINKVSNWLNGADAFLWRVNSKPEKRDERVAGFDAYFVRLYFNCDWLPSHQRPAFRVVQVK